MYCGIELVRNGQLVESVSWDNWLFDHFVGEYLLMTKKLPYVLELKDEPVVCFLRRKTLIDLADVLERQQFEVCTDLLAYYHDDEYARSYAAQYGPRLRSLAEKYRPGDKLRYCSEE